MNPSRLRLLVFVVIISAAFLITAAQPGYTQAPTATGPETKIAPWVMAHTADGATAEFLVVMADQANLSRAEKLSTKLEKGRYVYETLYRTAQNTQASIVQWLRERGIEYRSYYIVNLIWVKADRATALALAARSDVARIDGNPRIHAIPDRPGTPEIASQPDQPNAPGSNITYVRAPEVWAMGFTGQGIVVGGQDTGYDWTHPALQPHYRGWNGSTANHDYNWHDSIHSGGGVCGANSSQPCDDTDHGTHTMGTAIGDDGGTNQIGMAPGAKWIGCRNMDQGNGTPATYLECFEFFLAPYPVGGTPAQGDPSKAPDVTNNSWGCPPSEGCNAASLLTAVQAQRAAGIMTVVSAGNDGSACHTVQDPAAIYDEVYSVGALNTGSDTIASFSSRGSVTIDGSNRRKPDISAPGTNIRSSVPGGGYQSTGWSGTSMAGPHVAGAVALLWSARPALRHNIDLTEQVLSNSAVHINNATCDTPGTTWPNNTYGYGRLDIKAAVDSVPAGDSYLIGTVTNANNAAPISGATVTAQASGSQTVSTTTITNGQYSLLLMADTYTVTASAYGYQSAQVSGISVVSGTTTTQNITLTPALSYVVSGTVRDAVRGLPLTSTITVSGYPGGPVSTNPTNGFYSVTLAAGNVYTFSVTGLGYLTTNRAVGPLNSNRTEDFALNVDLFACTAPGYIRYGLAQSFDATTIPTGWVVINNVGSIGWTFNDPGGRGNLTGGTGNFAIADSDQAGSGVSMDTELRTPVFDLSTLSQVTLTFKTDFYHYSSEIADVDLSVNGAAGPWTNVWRKSGVDYRGPHTETLDLSSLAAHQANVMLRFHYYNAVFEYWWEVDDVEVGQCQMSIALPLPILTPTAAAQTANPGSSVTYTLLLSNTGTVSHTFDVVLGAHVWPVTAPLTLGPVNAPSAVPLTLTVTIPAEALANSSEVLTLTVRAQDNPALHADATLTTTANLVHGVLLEPATAQQAGLINRTVTYTLALTNTGNGTETFSLNTSLAHWPVQLAPLSVTLPAWGNALANVVVSVPLTATPLLTDVVRVTVTGSDVSDFSDLITRAVYAAQVYLPLILK